MTSNRTLILRTKFLFGLNLVLTIAACSTILVVDTTSRSSIQEALEVGDRIMLTTIDGEFFRLTITDLTEDSIEAENESEQTVTIPYEDIARVSMRQRQPGRTAAAVAGGMGAAAVFLYALAGLALAIALGSF